MTTLYIDCSMGAAGDMLAAALLELQPDPDKAVAELNALGIPGVEFVRESVTRCGIAATHLSVRVHGEEEAFDDDGHHHHHHVEEESDGHRHHHHYGDEWDGHSHHHHHRSLTDVNGIIGALPLPPTAMESARKVYALLAAAEGRVHGRSAEMVHFHEVGALDAVADIAACCYLMARLAPGRVVASPVHVGFGSVRCAHGTLPVPAPATTCLLEGVPIYSDGVVRGELCTPTGAAMLRHFISEFGPLPQMRVAATGYGAGSRDFDNRANVVRVFLGEDAGGNGEDCVWQVSCNIDDMTAEDLAAASAKVMEAGALDVTLVPAIMKKGRPGTVVTALCDDVRREAVEDALLLHTTTLGVRETRMRRRILERETVTVETAFGPIRVKKASFGGAVKVKPEFDDLAAASTRTGRPISQIREEAIRVQHV